MVRLIEHVQPLALRLPYDTVVHKHNASPLIQYSDIPLRADQLGNIYVETFQSGFNRFGSLRDTLVYYWYILANQQGIKDEGSFNPFPIYVDSLALQISRFREKPEISNSMVEDLKAALILSGFLGDQYIKERFFEQERRLKKDRHSPMAWLPILHNTLLPGAGRYSTLHYIGTLSLLKSEEMIMNNRLNSLEEIFGKLFTEDIVGKFSEINKILDLSKFRAGYYRIAAVLLRTQIFGIDDDLLNIVKIMKDANAFKEFGIEPTEEYIPDNVLSKRIQKCREILRRCRELESYKIEVRPDSQSSHVNQSEQQRLI